MKMYKHSLQICANRRWHLHHVAYRMPPGMPALNNLSAPTVRINDVVHCKQSMHALPIDKLAIR